MLKGFFHVFATKETVQVGPNVIVSPAEHIASVETINQKKPTKNFDLGDTFSFPKPMEHLVDLKLSETKFVVRRGFGCGRSPCPCPNISLSLLLSFTALGQQ